jgi:hypothetical protein
MTPFHSLPANQAALFSLARPTKKPDITFIGHSFGVIKTIPKVLQRREYNTVWTIRMKICPQNFKGTNAT